MLDGREKDVHLCTPQAQGMRGTEKGGRRREREKGDGKKLKINLEEKKKSISLHPVRTGNKTGESDSRGNTKQEKPEPPQGGET